MSVRIHDDLKNWLVKRIARTVDGRGKPYYTRVYSGDQEPVDGRAGKFHFDFRPDVVLDRHGKKWFIEIALSEDWRAIVGELFLVNMVSGFKSILFIISRWEYEFMTNVLHAMRNKYDLGGWAFLILDEKEVNNLTKAKKSVENYLTELDWI
ncbi:MAG: hypothetical protein KAU48_14730 [Candidatus Thorarchaeota archaeon]|nr:hypothetical protein [Candidatus Thorarchaeota archaeon]